MTTNYNIITCDGGGIRGLITAMLLDDLVSNPPKGYTANTILQNVNLFAGTSTGGIIAIGLSAGLAPSTLASLYASKCGNIFQPYQSSDDSSALSQMGLPQMSFNPCSWMAELCHVKYSNTGLYNVLSTILSPQVDPTSPLSTLLTLKNNTNDTSVLAVTLMLADTSNTPWTPLALTNLPNSNYADVAIIDAAMCSSAAPLYFPPYAVPPVPATKRMWCADGGVVANNPSTFAVGNVIQSQVLQQQKKELSNIRLLSLGTGATIDFVPWSFLNAFANNCGMAMWLDPLTIENEPAFPLMAAMFDGQAQIAHLEASNILGSQYQRANPTLTQTINLDDCGAIGELQSVAQDYIKSTEGPNDWASIKEWAYSNFI